MAKEINLTESLKKLEEIVEWFENQGEVDVEKGIEKVKEGVKLIKASRERLKKVEADPQVTPGVARVTPVAAAGE